MCTSVSDSNFFICLQRNDASLPVYSFTVVQRLSKSAKLYRFSDKAE